MNNWDIIEELQESKSLKAYCIKDGDENMKTLHGREVTSKTSSGKKLEGILIQMYLSLVYEVGNTINLWVYRYAQLLPPFILELVQGSFKIRVEVVGLGILRDYKRSFQFTLR